MVAQGVEDAVFYTIPAAAQGVREPPGCIVLGDFVRRSRFDELKDAGNVDRRHATHRTLVSSAERLPLAS